MGRPQAFPDGAELAQRDLKRCTKCGIIKPFSDFNRHGRGVYGLKSACRSCQHAADRAYRLRDPVAERARKRSAKYRARFRMSVEAVEALFASAGYKCEACGTHRNDTPNKCLVIDHDHACCPSEKTCGGCIRGVLCTKCNVALGALCDSLAKVRALVSYMETR